MIHLTIDSATCPAPGTSQQWTRPRSARLHAWWVSAISIENRRALGRRRLCGLAPDLYHGSIANTIAEAER